MFYIAAWLEPCGVPDHSSGTAQARTRYAFKETAHYHSGDTFGLADVVFLSGQRSHTPFDPWGPGMGDAVPTLHSADSCNL